MFCPLVNMPTASALSVLRQVYYPSWGQMKEIIVVCGDRVRSFKGKPVTDLLVYVEHNLGIKHVINGFCDKGSAENLLWGGRPAIRSVTILWHAERSNGFLPCFLTTRTWETQFLLLIHRNNSDRNFNFN